MPSPGPRVVEASTVDPSHPDSLASLGTRARSLATTVGASAVRAVVAVLPAWLLARVLVVLSLLAAHLFAREVRPDDLAARLRLHQGLLAWDGGWYQAIAGRGYVSSGVQSVRFYPGFPMAARALSKIPGISVGAALVLLANACALAAMAALWALVRHDFDVADPGLARRSVWLLALAPPAYVLAFAYADSALLLCAVVTFLAARSGRWWWAAAAGCAAGLVRPVGVLLVLPVVIEVWRTRPDRRSLGSWLGPVVAVVAPAVGTAGYLGWVKAQFGDFWLPFRVQVERGHRGSISAPFDSIGHDLSSLVHGHHVGSALHVPWLVLCVALAVLAFWRLPVSYAAFTAAVLAVAMSSSNLDSFERYTLGAFPLIIVASTLTRRPAVERVVLILSAAGMVGYACLVFLGVVVP